MIPVINKTIVMTRIVASQLKANRKGRNNVEDNTAFALRVRSFSQCPEALAHPSNASRILAIFTFAFRCPEDSLTPVGGDFVAFVFECAFEPWRSRAGAEDSGCIREELSCCAARLEFIVCIGVFCRSYGFMDVLSRFFSTLEVRKAVL